jgi:uncharacterized protein YacL
VVGLAGGKPDASAIILVPIAEDFAFFKPLAAILVSILFAYTGMTLMDTHGRAMMRLLIPTIWKAR